MATRTTAERGRGGETSLVDLPHSVLTTILSYLPAHDARFGARPACRSLRTAASDSLLWIALLERDFSLPRDLLAPHSHSLPAASLHARFQCERHLIPVRGILTDGGVDTSYATHSPSLQRYWVDALFAGEEVAPFHGFCSLEGKHAVNCLGVVCSSQPNRGFSAQLLRDRERMIERCADLARMHYNDHGVTNTTRERAKRALRRWPSSRLATLFLELLEHAHHSQVMLDHMYYGVPERYLAQEQAQCAELADRIDAIGLGPWPSDCPQDETLYRPFCENGSRSGTVASSNPSANIVATGNLAASSPGAVFKSVHVSRAGEFTCPCKIGAIFVASSNSATSGNLHDLLALIHQDPLSKTLDTVVSEEHTRSLAASGNLPQIRRRVQNHGRLSGGGVMLEFERQNNCEREALELAMLFEFAPSDLTRALDVSEFRDHLTLDLAQPRFGNALLVKLIKPEDLMQETNDSHEEPNIDLAGVDAYGVTLTKADGVEPP